MLIIYTIKVAILTISGEVPLFRLRDRRDKVDVSEERIRSDGDRLSR